MHPRRTQLISSRYWSVLRPGFPLSPGHFIIRLNDPAIAFSPDSATDLLRTYGQLRRAMTAVTGATGAQLYISRNWQPVGDAIGEPLAESSTPTLHTFFDWPGSPTAAAALKRPAHLRKPAPDTAVLDAAVQDWHGPEEAGEPAVPGTGGAADASAWGSRTILVEAVHPAASVKGPDAPEAATRDGQQPEGEGHWMAAPRSPVASLDRLGTAELLELASGVEQLAWHSGPRHGGMAVWANDAWGEPSTIHIFSRLHSPGHGLLADFVGSGGLERRLAGAVAAQGQSTCPSPAAIP